MTAATLPSQHAVVEDLLLLLFDPRSGTIAGEGTLYYALAGAVLSELALDEAVTIDQGQGLGGGTVRAQGDPPADPLLRDSWDRLQAKPMKVQTFLAGVGPNLREPVLDRVVARGDIHRERKKWLGFVPTTKLSGGASSHRQEMMNQVRPVFVDGAKPSPRVAVLGALVSASGSLPLLHHEIPWSGAVQQRGKELEAGNWGAEGVNEAVMRTTAAVVLGTVAATAAIASR